MTYPISGLFRDKLEVSRKDDGLFLFSLLEWPGNTADILMEWLDAAILADELKHLLISQADTSWCIHGLYGDVLQMCKENNGLFRFIRLTLTERGGHTSEVRLSEDDASHLVDVLRHLLRKVD